MAARKSLPSKTVLENQVNSAFKRHEYHWKNCQACPLHLNANKHVLLRGEIPADVLFVGEAPGESEDITGKPFIGPAGKVLDAIIAKVIERTKPFSYAITNTVACIPWNPVKEEEKREPVVNEIETCALRVNQLKPIIQPKLLILLGAVAERSVRHYQTYDKVPRAAVYHPSYVRRTGGASPKNANFTRTVLQISAALKKAKIV